MTFLSSCKNSESQRITPGGGEEAWGGLSEVRRGDGTVQRHNNPHNHRGFAGINTFGDQCRRLKYEWKSIEGKDETRMEGNLKSTEVLMSAG